MRRQAMHHDRIRLCDRQQTVVELIRTQHFYPSRLLLLLAHAGPDIGIEHIGAFDRHEGITQDLDGTTGSLGTVPRPINNSPIRLVSGRTGDADGHAHDGRAFQQRIRDIVAVADICNLSPL